MIDETVAACLREWRAQLLDTSKRNPLVSCNLKNHERGAVTLEHPSFDSFWETFVVGRASLVFQKTASLFVDEADEEVREEGPVATVRARKTLSADQLESCRTSDELLNHAMLTRLKDTALDARLKRLSVTAATSLSEQGVNSLFVACGFLQWFESPSSDVPIVSPLILVPVGLSRETTESEWELRPIDDELLPNHALAETLKGQFNLVFPTFPDDTIDDSTQVLHRYLEDILAILPDRWTITRAVAVGAFAFQKIAMWRDLGKHAASIVAHPICRGMAGDDGAMPTSSGLVVSERELDQKLPIDAHHLIVDCDSSQLAAIHAVKEGRNLILDGPPGTGKSQTITNIIAECLAAGKTVLFVSEKAAALEVVKRRLDQARVGDFCLDLHSHKANKRKIIEELGAALSRQPERHSSLDQQLNDLRRSRDRLNEYVRALHVRCSALDATPYEIHGRLAALRSATATRVGLVRTLEIDRDRLTVLVEAVGRLAGFRAILASRGEHPWRGLKPDLYRLNLEEDVRFHFRRASEGMVAQKSAAEPLVKLGFLPTRPSLKDLNDAVADCTPLVKYPSIPPTWVEAGLDATARAYLALHHDAEAYRILLSGLSNYRPGAVESAVEESFKEAACLTAQDGLVGDFLTVRSADAGCATAVIRLDSLDAALVAVQSTGDRLAALTGLRASAVRAFDKVEQLARDALMLADVVKLPVTWFDDATRRGLQKTVATVKPVAEVAMGARTALESRFHTHAFTDVVLKATDDLLRHAAWFRRLGSGWKRARRAFLELYRVPPSGRSRELIEDAYQLKGYQELLGQLAKLVGDSATALEWNEEPDFPWSAIKQQLVAIDALPPELRSAEAVSVRQNGIDDPDLHFEADQVARACSEAQSAFALLKQHVDVRQDAALSQLLRVSIFKSRSAIQSARERFEGARHTLGPVLKWIDEGRDVELNALKGDFSTLLEVRTLRSRCVEAAERLGVPVDAPESHRVCDVGVRATLAEWVVDFMESCNSAPPAPVLTILTDADARSRLTRAMADIRCLQTPEVDESLHFVRSLFDVEELNPAENNVDVSSIEDASRWLDDRVRDAGRVSEWVGFANACTKLREQGLAVLCEEMLSQKISADRAIDALNRTFCMQWLDDVYRIEPTLRDFDVADHEQHVARFQELDKAWIANGYARVRQKVLAASPRRGGLDADAPGNSEVGILQREINKKTRHLPIRKLFARIPTLLPQVKPCVMMSPLSVSTYFESGASQFDVVIFDEASQVRPHDAVCAIYRGRQLVIAGDQKQLPPSNFFEKLVASDPNDGDDSGQATGSLRDFESILDVCASLGLPRQRLKWHYRSRRESLIAFSNRHFYDSDLITFPSALDVSGSSGVEFVLVQNGCWSGGASGGGVNAIEANAVADAVVRFAESSPARSLGVITMNQAQQDRVMDEIDTRRRGRPELESFFSVDSREPFFVKNLENVQGDERDVIFLTIGYAKNSAGTLNHNFGPLIREGGERRLNVAVTRAREKLRVFSSIVSDDIDLSRTNSRGTKLLKAYLDFARRGPVALGAEVTSDGERGFDSDFEREVARALVERGLDVRRQVGCSGFRIDLALADPRQPGRYVLGIECDGATYHSSATARDRDRLRQEVLEGLGWKLCRIWSTDWVRDPLRQIERVLSVYAETLSAGPVIDPARPTQNHVSVEVVPDSTTPARSVQFSDIADVPHPHLRQTLEVCIRQYGVMPQADLIREAAKQLGFNRVGTRIRERLDAAVQNLIKLQVFKLDDGRVALGRDE